MTPAWHVAVDQRCSAHQGLDTGRAIRNRTLLLSTVKPPHQRAGGERGYDGGKGTSGSKRHLVVDTQGLILPVLVHLADGPGRCAAEAELVEVRGRYPAAECLLAAIGY